MMGQQRHWCVQSVYNVRSNIISHSLRETEASKWAYMLPEVSSWFSASEAIQEQNHAGAPGGRARPVQLRPSVAEWWRRALQLPPLPGEKLTGYDLNTKYPYFPLYVRCISLVPLYILCMLCCLCDNSSVGVPTVTRGARCWYDAGSISSPPLGSTQSNSWSVPSCWLCLADVCSCNLQDFMSEVCWSSEVFILLHVLLCTRKNVTSLHVP